MKQDEKRLATLHLWIERGGFRGHLEPLRGDASQRRFFRFIPEQGSPRFASAIAMDIPPGKESVERFVAASSYFNDLCILRFPRLYAVDLDQGFALVEDFGDQLLESELAAGRQDLYKQAIDGLIELQTVGNCDDAPWCSVEALMQEMYLFTEWYIAELLQLRLDSEWQLSINANFRDLAQSWAKQPHCLVHRDFHCRNLLLRNGEICVVDFQDACVGAYTYDLVSLLRDAYHECTDWTSYLDYYYQRSAVAQLRGKQRFENDFHCVCTQRMLKVVGVFSRLSIRDHKSDYLHSVPLVMRYLRESLHHLEGLEEVKELVHDIGNRALPENTNPIHK